MECRHCGFDLDRGDIFDCLKARYPTTSDADLEDMASSFGWTRKARKHFTKVVIIQDDTRNQLEVCPECGGESPITQDSDTKVSLINDLLVGQEEEIDFPPPSIEVLNENDSEEDDSEEDNSEEEDNEPWRKYNPNYKWPSMPTPFTLTEKQYAKYYEWAQQFKKSNMGAIGGIFTFSFTPTTIGTVVKVHGLEGKEIDLTDYNSW